MTPESSVAPAGPSSRGSFAKALLLVTAIAGTLDIVAAHLHVWAIRGTFPTTMFKSIAGGALGRTRAQQGGTGTILLGAFFHYFIAFAFTLLFFLLYPRLAVLRKNRLASGAVYALFVWGTMNFVVLPLSALHSSMPNFANKHTYVGIGILIAMIGVPIAVGVDRFYARRVT
jgi:hypothetical protein